MNRTKWVLAAAAILVAVSATIGVILNSTAGHETTAGQGSALNTATVQRGTLSDMVSQYGTLTYRARSDGAPYAVINRSPGVYTMLPNSGDRVRCGEVLYRVNDDPVLLLCGSTPSYRSLSEGAIGPDVTELNTNLVELGYATRAELDPTSKTFSFATSSALKKLQSRLGEDQTGTLPLGQSVFLPASVRVADVSGELGGSAEPGSHVLSATSDTLEVQLALDPSQQSAVKAGDRAQITLPDTTSVTGKVERLGRVAQVPAGQNTSAAAATIPAYLSLDHPEQAHGLDMAPVQVEITTAGVGNALSVPATAIVGKAGGGFAVELDRPAGARELVAVHLGLFDTAGGRVQIEGNLREGDHVVVPTS